jgi:hypothetical protein
VGWEQAPSPFITRAAALFVCLAPSGYPCLVTTITEAAAGVRDWPAFHPNIRAIVHSHWVPAAATVIDPLLDDDTGIEMLRDEPPRQILLSNRHHLRSSEEIAAEFGATIHCHRAGLHQFEDGPEVAGFDWGDEPAPGIEALEVGVLCDEETALLIRDAGALAIADAITNDDGELGFFADRLLGDDPEAVKSGIRDSFRALLDRDFDTLLFAHGPPISGDGKDVLRDFCG